MDQESRGPESMFQRNSSGSRPWKPEASMRAMRVGEADGDDVAGDVGGVLLVVAKGADGVFGGGGAVGVGGGADGGVAHGGGVEGEEGAL